MTQGMTTICAGNIPLNLEMFREILYSIYKVLTVLIEFRN